MPRKAAELGPLAVSRLAAPGMHAVGGVSGLYLQILPSGGRSWVLRASVAGKRRDMGLGGFPDVPLADARRKAREAREAIDAGEDPIAARRAAKAALLAKAGSVLTFRQAALDYIAAHEASWKNPKHRQQWRSTLEEFAFPTLGKLSVQDIETSHLLTVLRPIWAEKTETASRLRGRIEQVLDAARATGAIKGVWENPARWRGHLDKVLAAKTKIAKPEHHAALPVSEVAEFMPRLRSAEGMGARALEFAILTACRSGEVRGARWSEIDLAEKVWTIPAARMKGGREHRVPLSPAAVALLEKLPRIAGNDLVFTAQRGGELSDMTLTAVLRRMKVPATAHGFRSTFRDWAAERTNYPRDVAEMALAHTIGSKVEAAYRRGDLFAKRTRMMADWAKFCAQPVAQAANVTPLRGRA
ncbi:MAG: integrase [Phenylobacterium sp. RIFCSPHIGHO2_01_FULL_69_31]|uniref:tyrosine-type recombinase/integrase n=1 Tax=Phenylobacterium sp. RIFCSPHIGHO2_01_FULL_69_31 TaxID=1801944 RepID=UPI0008C9F38A|nr:site-specific integrase [Phenylobacterium sp. RIFCSPHIGHO2_01_FULL_69_31]OHB28143.1 MAG: integrase [Phenylobacterium sp. RIFCSPHIGHO2_01_FULL_69_31]